MKYTQLTFPLNVYAHLLFLELGRVDYLHYGIWDENHTDVTSAQNYSTELILKNLPAPPCEILEIGIGLGTTFGLLSERGYAVTGLTPDPYQHDIARKGNINAAGLILSSFEEYDPADKLFDVLLLQESFQYLDTLQLLQKASLLLKPNGLILILDEVGMTRTTTESENLPLLAHLQAQAERWGFNEEKVVDLSAQALPTIDFLLEGLKTHRLQLLKDLPVNEEQFEHLQSSLLLYKQKYIAGEYGYAFVCLRKNDAPPRWQITSLLESDVPAMQKLFKQVFAKEMSQALWHWKYGDGRGVAIIGRRNSEIVSHYGGMIRNVLFKGEPRQEVQIGDVMVSPKERGTFTRKGLFFLTAATFLERYIGFGAKFSVGFGFPNERMMRLAKLQGLYGEVDRVTDVRWQPAPKFPCLLTDLQSISLDTFEKRRPAIDFLWDQMAEDLRDSIVGVRNAAFIKHRYLEHPEHDYHVILIRKRFSHGIKGLIVLRQEENCCLLLDLLGALVDIPLLIKHARRLTTLWGKDYLYTWITESHLGSLVCQDSEVEKKDIFIPMNIWTTGVKQDDVRNSWWLMPGDTDFL
ncbi:MAG: GNAT family N-acetyltransferase [Desulfobulbaceae bacterium]|jgi:SAM-dependent methyltransferase|nr:GNAT family N-acetyltransferase [Desulfobulbaceae bacterium]